MNNIQDKFDILIEIRVLLKDNSPLIFKITSLLAKLSNELYGDKNG